MRSVVPRPLPSVAGRPLRACRRTRHRIAQAMAAGALAVTLAAPLHAQGTGNGYLFGQPDVRLSIRGGYNHASAGGDLIAELTDQFTLSKSDFSGLNLGAELGFRVAPRIDVGVDLGFVHSKRSSEYRHFVDNDNQPIVQTTTFDRVPFTANVRAYLVSPGRSVGRLAWIPTAVVPWIGAGGGATYYRLHQDGDFINPSTNVISADRLKTSGWAPTLQGMGGVDVTLTPRMAVTGDARYTWAHARPGNDYVGFDRIDLSGVSATLGLTFRL
jgi:hypothetical protein